MGGSTISRTQYLHWVTTKRCQIFNIGNGHNYLGVKPLKSAIYEMLSNKFLLKHLVIKTSAKN